MSGIYYIRASGCTDDNDSCRPCLRALNREQERYKQLYNDMLDCLDEKCRELAELRAECERLRQYERIWNETCLATAHHAAPEGRE